jgi:hypothetical protein
MGLYDWDEPMPLRHDTVRKDVPGLLGVVVAFVVVPGVFFLAYWLVTAIFG